MFVCFEFTGGEGGADGDDGGAAAAPGFLLLLVLSGWGNLTTSVDLILWAQSLFLLLILLCIILGK